MRYEAYKDSGVDWIGEIPEGWEMLSNKYIFNLKKNQVGKNSAEYELLSLTLRGIIKRDMENPEGKFPAEFDTYQEVKKGDFVFCLFDVEETPRTVGLSDFDGMITGAYTVFNVSEKVNRKFLYYFYLNLDEKKRLKFLYKGLRNTIPKDSFFTFKTAVPPIAEQQAIAQFLDDKTAKIDQLIGIKQKEIELLKERRQILIQQAVTGKWSMVNGQWLKTQTEKLKPSGVDWIGEIPEHWEVIPNRYIFKQKKVLVGKKSAEYDLLSLTLKGVIKRDMENPEGKFPAEFDTYQEVKYGDFVFCLFDVEETPRTVGLSNFDGMITGAYTVITVNTLFNKKYLYYYYLSLDEKKKLKYLYKGLRNTIPKDLFFSLKTIIPAEREQIKIVSYLEAIEEKIAKAISIKEQEIEKLKEYKTVLIDNVVTGKVRIN